MRSRHCGNGSYLCEFPACAIDAMISDFVRVLASDAGREQAKRLRPDPRDPRKNQRFTIAAIRRLKTHATAALRQRNSILAAATGPGRKPGIDSGRKADRAARQPQDLRRHRVNLSAQATITPSCIQYSLADANLVFERDSFFRYLVIKRCPSNKNRRCEKAAEINPACSKDEKSAASARMTATQESGDRD
jgi:hypothetical protein